MRWIAVGLLVVLAAAAGGLVFWRCDGTRPEVEVAGPIVLGREARTVEVDLADPGSGLRDAWVEIETPTGPERLVEESFPGGWLLGGEREVLDPAFRIELDARRLGLPDGAGVLRVGARDWSWETVFGGGATEVEVPFTVDTRPPSLAVEQGSRYLRVGGAGVVVYRVGEDAVRDGVEVGDRFFRAHPHPAAPDRRRVAFFGIPHDAPADVGIRVVAEDAAGNDATGTWPADLRERRLRDDEIRLPQRFLDTKVVELAQQRGIDPADRVAAFQRINEQGRAEDEARVREATQESVAQKLWDGAFEQLAGSQVTSHFAERRTYLVDGEEVSRATHFGYDLATTAQGPVTASNAGRVTFAGDLGIYGGCVLIDHGFDLFTLYGHLSRIDVEPGERVDKGQVIGLSGATGLAGGDHLHFAVLLGGVYVDPVEWWDPRWIEQKVEAVLGEMPAPSDEAAGGETTSEAPSRS